MNLLTKYIIALANFYGVVSPQIVVAVYNQQNEHQISEEDVQENLFNPPKELAAYGVFKEGSLFVQESLFIGEDTLIRLVEEKNEKPYYIPTKKELKKYLDSNYIEKNEHYYRLYIYLRKKFRDLSDNQLEKICNDFVFVLKEEELNFGYIIRQLRSAGISLEDSADFQHIVKLIAALGDNVRLWEKNGFTRKEYFENKISVLLHYEVYQLNTPEKVLSQKGNQQEVEYPHTKQIKKVRRLEDYRH